MNCDMEKRLYTRRDLMSAFNAARFVLRHYAMGYYMSVGTGIRELPVNRMLFPLDNPGGRANYIRDGRDFFPLVPGKMYFIPACYPAEVNFSPDVYFLSVQSSFEVFPGVDLFSGCSRILATDARNEAEELERIFHSPPEELYGMAVALGSFVLHILADVRTRFAPEEFWKVFALREYGDLTEYLHKNGTAATRVSDLAAARNESRENFTRHFSARTGITPKALIDRIVTGKCLSLIGEGYSFKEIADILEFPDEYVFSRYFKRNVGISPRVWRDSVKKDLRNSRRP